MADVLARRNETDVPLTVAVTKNSGGIPGLTVVAQVRDGDTVDSFLDFADNTFKTAGWTTKQAPLADRGDGFYDLSGGLDLSALTNLPAATDVLLAEYFISGSRSGIAIDQVILAGDIVSPGVADAVWDELLTGHELAGSTGRSLGFLRDILFGNTRIDRSDPNQWVEQHLDAATGLVVVAEYDLEGLDGTPISDANNPFVSPTDLNAAFMRRLRTLGTP